MARPYICRLMSFSRFTPIVYGHYEHLYHPHFLHLRVGKLMAASGTPALELPGAEALIFDPLPVDPELPSLFRVIDRRQRFPAVRTDIFRHTHPSFVPYSVFKVLCFEKSMPTICLQKAIIWHRDVIFSKGL